MSKQVVIRKIEDGFEPEHIFECGQCFRWKREADGSYTFVAFGKVVNVLKKDGYAIFSNTNEEEFENVWHQYFDLNTDYSKIKNTLLNVDENLKKATHFGSGIRILKQDLWECVVSFIISANNNIPRIQGIIERLCESFGKEIEYSGKKYYTFPESKDIVGDLSHLRAGYRDSYIKDACEAFISGKFSGIENLSTEEARKLLLTIKGIGPKVCDCILLFGLNRREVFPVDVWVKRTLNELYKDEVSKTTPHKFAENKFGDLAGYAQQYLFYYMREMGANETGGVKNA
ncbi:MAG: 8-oxoguanine DNA glycosylase [Clostridia bacterium]|nr:8-oxoguanine DNA glycosylase [Clostridia bacterium]